MTTRRTAIAGLVATLLLGLSSAGIAAPTTVDNTPGDIWKRTELYFGGSKPDGSVITPAEFESFVDKQVTPAFPDGLTWLPAHGQWMGGKEDSYVVIIFYPLTNRHANKDIEEIRTDYKTEFHQESVLRADGLDKVSF
ncbi:DUF3574 domain-containing protein [Kibdelosporangium lantanae]|uniref:DUF3574 domain-containing protein n=1 Tax=Kibdelosporangium lantanae TaxID=1497396 RepID=A0ABW3MH59_9PSEU